MDKTMITSLAWIKKGYARSMPKEFDLEELDLEELKNDPLVQKQIAKDKNDMGLEYYDNESSLPVFSGDFEKYKNNMQNKQEDDNYPDGFEDMSEEEKEDYAINPSDAIIVAGKLDDEFSTLEVFIYEELKCNLYVHHEITLSAFPLCLEWLPIEFSSYNENSASKGNYLIVGTFLPEIEIWNLDVVNSIEPTMTLGGEKEQNKKKAQKFSKKNKKNLKEDSHEDSVICLSLNKFRKNIVSSGSADKSIKIWDLTQNKCAHTYKLHSDKVQILKWNPSEETILLSGGFDKKLIISDVRQANSALNANLTADIESGLWDPLNPTNILFSMEDGTIAQLDARKFNSNYVFHTKAHDKAATGITMSHHINGMIATTSLDGSIKIWDNHNINNNAPQLVAMKNAKANKLFCGNFYEDNPWLLACGSSAGELVVWDTCENTDVLNHFESRINNKKMEFENN